MLRRLIAYVPGLFAAGLLALIVLTADLPEAAQTVALACISISLAFALLARTEDVRLHGGTAFGIFAVTAAGWTRGGILYGAAAALYALVAVLTIRGGALRLRVRAAPQPVLLLAGTAAVVGVLVAVGLPAVGRIIARHIASVALAGDGDSVGFTSELRLGSTIDMLESDRVVLRVYGARPPLLRGAVLDRYESWVWTSSHDDVRKTASANQPERETTSRVIVSRKARVARGSEARWFLPPRACGFHTETGKIAMDEMAIGHPLVDEDAIAFRTGCLDAPVPTPPRPTDLDVPKRIAKDLGPIAARFTSGASTDNDKLDAILRELARYPYALRVSREGRIDPVIDFLTIHKEGHCELFASAFALLARQVGVPARVVTGYRVEEVNRFGDYAVVRDRDAHAWVEAWVNGAWRTYDPTPLAEGPVDRPSFADEIADLAGALRDRVVVFGVTRILGGLGAFVVLVALARRIADLVAARIRARAAATRAGASLPCFKSLEGALAQAGLRREPSEPIEVFARRVVATCGDEGAWSRDVAAALVAYARLRYGGEGAEAAVAQLLERATLRVPGVASPSAGTSL